MNSIQTPTNKDTTDLANQSISTGISNLTTNSVSSSANVNKTKDFQTPNSIRKSRNGTFHSFPIVNTPTPPSRFRKIVNPFEVGITERLHLPSIDRLVGRTIRTILLQLFLSFDNHIILHMIRFCFCF